MSAELEALVREVAPRCSSFRQLASRCLGAWPVAVARTLGRIAAEPGVDREGAARLLADAVGSPPAKLSTVRGLPPEHPLDGDWRFAPDVPRKLLRRLLKAGGTRGRVLLACVPPLAIIAEQLGVADRCVVAVRESDPVADAVRRLAPHAAYRGFDELAGIEAGAALIDPPWYDDVALPIVQCVCAGVREGGTVLISGPDLLTAASRALAFSAGAPSAWPGLRPTGTSARVRCRTPAFEARALLAAGVRNVPAFWRTGLVYEYERCGPRAAAPLPFGPGEGWTEVPFGACRLWIRPAAVTGEEARIIVADTVSRTSPLRAGATAWTSANTVVTGGTQAEILSLARPDSVCADGLRARLIVADENPCWQRASRGPCTVALTDVEWENDSLLPVADPVAPPPLETPRWRHATSSPSPAA